MKLPFLGRRNIAGTGAAATGSFDRFMAQNPRFAETIALDELRTCDYARLDRAGHAYLDYTGGGLYAQSQLDAHHALLSASVLGNPHSENPTSLAATALVEEARAAVLDFFNADPEEYDVIFTANASGALKLVGESYQFGPDGCFLLSYDNHNSVNGIREFARAAGADVTYIPVRNPALRLDAELMTQGLECAKPGGGHLFAYPAQSNFSGVQHPLEWVELAQSRGWHVLLDCAAYAPTNHLDLSVIHPDFVPLSFYKMFGYPTGTGALIARREALTKLRRPWFAGGTITLASVYEGWHHLAPGHTGFEDGTVDYLGLPAITIGLNHLRAAGIDRIHDRVSMLADWLLSEMCAMHHSNGAPLAKIFGPETMERRGSTIAFYLLDPAGKPYDVYAIETAAGAEKISVRTGCFCNPGDGEIAHEVNRAEIAECFDETPVTLQQCQRLIEDHTGKVPNTIRVSLGIASNFSDIERFLEFAAGYLDRVR